MLRLGVLGAGAFLLGGRIDGRGRCGGLAHSHWEEVDLSLRLREAGYTIRYVPTAVCWHAGGTTGRGSHMAEYGRGRVADYFRLMRRHATAAQWLSFLAVLPLEGLRLLGAQLHGGNWGVARAQAVGLLGGMGRERKVEARRQTRDDTNL